MESVENGDDEGGEASSYMDPSVSLERVRIPFWNSFNFF